MKSRGGQSYKSKNACRSVKLRALSTCQNQGGERSSPTSFPGSSRFSKWRRVGSRTGASRAVLGNSRQFQYGGLLPVTCFREHAVYNHPRRPRGKIIGREEDKTAVSVGAKVYFSCVETKVNFRADRNRRSIFLAPHNLAPGVSEDGY